MSALNMAQFLSPYNVRYWLSRVDTAARRLGRSPTAIEIDRVYDVGATLDALAEASAWLKRALTAEGRAIYSVTDRGRSLLVAECDCARAPDDWAHGDCPTCGGRLRDDQLDAMRLRRAI
jgi:hypothetical protein